MQHHRGRLFDHVHLRVADVEASKRFYRAVFASLGLSDVFREAPGRFYGFFMNGALLRESTNGRQSTATADIISSIYIKAQRCGRLLCTVLLGYEDHLTGDAEAARESWDKS